MPSLSGLPSTVGRVTSRASAPVRSVRITTNISPEVTVDVAPGERTGQAGQGGAAELLGKLLRPRIVVETAAGPLVLEPYGEPQPIIGLGLLLLLGYAVVRAVRG